MITDAVTLSAMTCIAETWTLTKHQEKKIAVVQRRIERSLDVYIEHHKKNIDVNKYGGDAVC